VAKDSTRVSTGIPGLDRVLRGGLLSARVYLVHGDPGTGKTTFGMHFLAAGLAAAERCLLITFGPSEAQIRRDAKALGLNIEGAAILDLAPPPEAFSQLQIYDIFTPAEADRDSLSMTIARAIESNKPKRIFVDCFEQFQQLASDPFHHRRLVQSFFRFATQCGETVVVACEETTSARDVDGIIRLDFAHEGRSLRVTKFRGSDFHAGHHPMRLADGGLQVLMSAA
jgi:circadian clock protein KaiC